MRWRVELKGEQQFLRRRDSGVGRGRTFQAEEVAYAEAGSTGGHGMFRELQMLGLCGPVREWVREEAGRRAGPEPGFVPPATQTCSEHLPNWVLGPEGTLGCRNGARECAGNSGHVVWASEMALHAGLGFHPGGEWETVSVLAKRDCHMFWGLLGPRRMLSC